MSQRVTQVRLTPHLKIHDNDVCGLFAIEAGSHSLDHASKLLTLLFLVVTPEEIQQRFDTCRFWGCMLWSDSKALHSDHNRLQLLNPVID